MVGVHVHRACRIDASSWNIYEDAEGGITSDPVAISVAYDTYPDWLEVAVGHAKTSHKAGLKVNSIWVDGSSAAELRALIREFQSSMQAIVATASAYDAFHGTLKVLCGEQNSDARAGKSGNGSRYGQIAERIKQAFPFTENQAAEFRDHLKQVFGARDEAVHSKAETRPPPLHPRLPVAMDQKFVMFRAENALTVVGSAIDGLCVLLQQPKAKFPALVNHSTYARERIAKVSFGRKSWKRLLAELVPTLGDKRDVEA